MSACPATWPPKTRWRSSLGWMPRKMLTSMGSRSSRLTRNSKDALMRPCSQAAVGGAAAAGQGAPAPTTLRRVTATRGQHDDGALEFPEGFTWGVATAAHQIEGGNVNNDWWAWEHNPHSGTIPPRVTEC